MPRKPLAPAIRVNLVLRKRLRRYVEEEAQRTGLSLGEVVRDLLLQSAEQCTRVRPR